MTVGQTMKTRCPGNVAKEGTEVSRVVDLPPEEIPA
jgi:hypothetical protein